VTPETQAAIDRVSATLDRYNGEEFTATLSEMDEFMEDVRALVAALDPAEQPIDHIPTPRGINYLAMRREQQPPTRSCGHPLGGTVNCCGADQ
jgi:tetrahydromethanopterin S-methyltransferase subunit B